MIELFDSGDSYFRFLQERQEKVVYMKPWPGNSGDVLIWMGTEELLSRLQIRRTRNPAEADIILIPGGNQTMWDSNMRIWQQVWAQYPEKEFVVGPGTYSSAFPMWSRAVSSTSANVKALFARDKVSYDSLLNADLPEGIYRGLSHDPALFLAKSAILAEHKKAATEEYVLAAFRADHEGIRQSCTLPQRSARALLPNCIGRRLERSLVQTRKKDLLAMVKHASGRKGLPVEACDASLELPERFFEIVRAAAEVHTDRLHCMLLSVLLGKPTFAYPTSYGKLEAVFDHSLKGCVQVEFPCSSDALQGLDY